jgi:hypothetical protein
MSTPTAPTAALLVTEAWKQCGVESPTTDQVTRGTTYFLEQILDDIWNTSVQTGNTRLKTLEETLVAISVKGTIAYDLAADFDEELNVTILDGDRRGTAQAGGATSITLASDESITLSDILGKQILVTGGTGSGGYRQVVDYDTTTKVATVDSAWAVNPAVSSTYLIVSKRFLIPEMGIGEIREYQPLSAARPMAFMKMKRQLIFDRPFDISTYGILIDYFVNIHQVDRTEGSTTLFTRMLTNWRTCLLEGLEFKILEYLDDNRQQTKLQMYQAARSALLVKEIPYGGEWTGFSI